MRVIRSNFIYKKREIISIYKNSRPNGLYHLFLEKYYQNIFRSEPRSLP